LLVVNPVKILKWAKLAKVVNKLKLQKVLLWVKLVKLLETIRLLKKIVWLKIEKWIWKIFLWYDWQVEKINSFINLYPRYNYALAFSSGWWYSRIYNDIKKAEKAGNAKTLYGKVEVWFKWKVFIEWNILEKIEKVIEHVMKWGIKKKKSWYEYEWIHSLNEFKKWDYILEVKHWKETYYNPDGTVNTKDYPYRWRVIIKDKDGNLIEKFANGWESSFFPDWWDRKRIMEEVKYAIENNIW
jgi:hypothetical protein